MSVKEVAGKILPNGAEAQWIEIESGYMNQSWIGSFNDENLYVLREHRRTDDRDEILAEHRLLAHLSEELGDLVAPPVVSANGDTLHRVDGKYYALFPYRHGQPMAEFDLKQSKPAARTLAQVHSLMIIHRDQFDDIKTTRPYLSALHYSGIDDLKNLLEKNSDTERLKKQGFDADFIQHCYEQVMQTLTMSDLVQAERCPIHGDYASLNLLWNAEQKVVTTVLDWEETRWDSPIFDLASASQFFCWNDRSEDLSGDFIPEYLNTLKDLNPELYNHMESLVPVIPKVRQAIWLFESLILLREDKVDIEELEELCRWLKL